MASRQKSITTKGGAKQEFRYDVQGNIIGIIDGNKHKIEFKLDKWGKITEILKPDGSSEYYVYDYAGNIAETLSIQFII